MTASPKLIDDDCTAGGPQGAPLGVPSAWTAGWPKTRVSHDSRRRNRGSRPSPSGAGERTRIARRSTSCSALKRGRHLEPASGPESLTCRTRIVFAPVQPRPQVSRSGASLRGGLRLIGVVGRSTRHSRSERAAGAFFSVRCTDSASQAFIESSRGRFIAGGP